MDSSSNNSDGNLSDTVAFFARTRLAYLNSEQGRRQEAGGSEQGRRQEAGGRGAGISTQGEFFFPFPMPSLSIVNTISHTLHFDNWDFSQSIVRFKEYIKRASRLFGVDDIQEYNAEFFIKVKLIKLLFANKNFDLILKGLLLFAYIDYLNQEFTSPTILKLNRLGSRKFRRYTWQGKDVKPHQFMRNLLADKIAAVIAVEVLPVIWKFQKSTKQLLLLTI